MNKTPINSEQMLPKGFKILRRGWIWEKYGTIIGLVGVMVIFSILRPETFPTHSNFIMILKHVALTGIVSFGLTVCLVMGEFDLSIGWAASFVGIITTGLMSKTGISPILAVSLGLVAALIIGLCNGLVVTKLRVSAFIGTLAMGSILIGLNFLYTGGKTFYSGIAPEFLKLAEATFGIPNPVIFMGIAFFLIYIMLNHTELGRSMYAIGGNTEAARLAGINITATRVKGFMICGITAGVGGILMASKLQAGFPQAGDSFLLDAFAAVFLGAATFKQGEFNVPGTLVGVIIMGVVFNGMAQLEASFYLQRVVQGLVLIGAVAISGVVGIRNT